MTATQVLQLDATGFPQNWISCEDAALYYATDSVAWTLGEVMHTLRGGYNAALGGQSLISVHPVIAVSGVSRVNLFDAVPTLSNSSLFKRDKFTCGYCGRYFHAGKGLTRDHIVPVSKGGPNSFENCISACRLCNSAKGCKLLEEAGMKLLFTPYAPSIFEAFILRGRNISGDAHAYLAKRVSKNSRWGLSGAIV
jgi:hypothetical protein